MYKGGENFNRVKRFTLLIFLSFFFFLPVQGENGVIKEIKIQGNKAIKAERIRERMKMFPDTPFFPYIFYDDVDGLKKYYRDNGFPDARITAEYETAPDGVVIQFFIEEGKPEIITGLLFSPENEIASQLRKRFLHQRWSLSIEQTLTILLTEDYQKKGYYKPHITIKKEKIGLYETTLEIVAEKGQRFYFGEIYCTGLDRIPVRFVLREAPFHSGDLFNIDKIRLYQERIYSLGVFEDINISIVDAGKTVTLLVDVKEGKAKWVGLDLGYTSPAVGRIGLEWGNNNVFNKMHRFRIMNSNEIDFETMNHKILFDLNYSMGWVLNRRFDLAFINSAAKENQDKGKKTQLSFKIIGRKKLSGNQEISGGYEKRLDYYSEIYSEERMLPTEEWLITNGLIAEYYRDNLLNKVHPRETGYFFKGKSFFSGGFLEGDFHYIKTQWEGAFYWDLSRNNHILAFHGALRTLSPMGGDLLVPYDELFSLGGAYDLRGYAFKEYGDAFYKTALGNVEYRFLLSGSFWGELFWDVAAGADEHNSLDLQNGEDSFGGGLRFVLPFLIIRVNYGMRDFKEEGLWHFVLGQVF
jgi:outer membrane protein assembly factor BamA